jgi:hypothetical protein
MRMGAGGGSCDSFRDSRRRHLDCCRKRGDSLQTPETGRRGPNQRARIAALLGAERGRTALGARGVQGRGAPRPHLGIANLGKAPTGRCDGQALSRNGGPSGVDPRGQLLLCGRIIPTPVLVIDCHQLQRAMHEPGRQSALPYGTNHPIRPSPAPAAHQVSCTGLDVCSTITAARLDPSTCFILIPSRLHIMSRCHRRSLKPVCDEPYPGGDPAPSPPSELLLSFEIHACIAS